MTVINVLVTEKKHSN